MIHELHVVLSAVWQFGAISFPWEKVLVVLVWKEKGDQQDCNSYCGITVLRVYGKVLPHLLAAKSISCANVLETLHCESL